MPDVNDILRKYSKKIESEMRDFNSMDRGGPDFSSREYKVFKEGMMPELSRYERWAKSLGGIVRIKLAKKDRERVGRELASAHLEVTPDEAVGLAFASFLIMFFLGILLSTAIWFLGSSGGLEDFPILFLLMIFFTGLFVFYYFYSMPSRLAIKWRLKASSQMVPAILYMVIYMKHTSNLERAVNFVSQHIEPPLSLDLKKILWDIETGKYSTIKESLDNYFDYWINYNPEFVESFHLIESSLYEPSEARRIQILERALRVILDGVYERMLKYTHSIKSPLTNLYMLGIVLPTLGLALLPLASTLLGGVLKWNHVFLLFNVMIPFLVFYLTMQIMLKRPGGYGETSMLDKNPNYYQYVSKRPYVIAGLITFPFLLIGLIPLIFGYTPVPEWLGLQSDYVLKDIGISFMGNGMMFDYSDSVSGKNGPFGTFALLLSLFVPLSVSLFFFISFRMRTKELIVSRNQTRDLEKEFTSTLFTLGNRIGDGTPAEIAFAKVAHTTKGQKTEEFFNIVNANIQSMGMGIEDAIFNPKRGALIFFPSALIATSMRILIESVKKGLQVAAQSLMSISEYVRNIQKINDRLKDLLAEVVSDMRGNMTFLAPLLSGIVVGLTAMITGILSQLRIMTKGGGDELLAGLGGFANIADLFDVTVMIPPYYLQIAIGIYIVEIIFILTGTLVTIDSGEDKLKRTHDISKNLFRGIMLYFITALVSIIALSLLSAIALGSLAGG